jgi:hypothetical protein
MTPDHFPLAGGAHLSGRDRLSFRSQTTGNGGKISGWKTSDGAQQDAIAFFLYGEFGSRRPVTGSPNLLGQDNLPFGGKPGNLHGKTPVRL